MFGKQWVRGVRVCLCRRYGCVCAVAGRDLNLESCTHFVLPPPPAGQNANRETQAFWSWRIHWPADTPAAQGTVQNPYLPACVVRQKEITTSLRCYARLCKVALPERALSPPVWLHATLTRFSAHYSISLLLHHHPTLCGSLYPYHWIGHIHQ